MIDPASPVDSSPQSSRKRLTSGQIAQLCVSLDHIEPTIWRRVEAPLSNTLKQLHRVIQATMRFDDYHLFEFEVDGDQYGLCLEDDDDTPAANADEVTLQSLTARGSKTFSYLYDFGDDWRHTVVIEHIRDADPETVYPRFLAGARAAPPEDVGGVSGFEHFIAAMTVARHPDKARLRQWYGRQFDPEAIDAANIIARLKCLSA